MQLLHRDGEEEVCRVRAAAMLISRSAMEGQLRSAAVASGPGTNPILLDIPRGCPAAMSRGDADPGGHTLSPLFLLLRFNLAALQTQPWVIPTL